MNLFAKPKFQVTFLIMLLVSAAIHVTFLWLQNYPLEICLVESTFSLIILWLLCYMQGNLLGYYSPQQSRQLFIIGWAFVLSIIWASLVYGLMKLYSINNIAYYANLKSNLFLRGFIVMLFINAVGFYNMLWQNQQYQLELQDTQDEVKQLAKDAELFKLRQQIQPHFLFNSLNSINALITVEPKLARTMIQQLSDFLRATLKKEDTELIALTEEIKYLDLYMSIEKIRFGHRLSITKDIASICLEKKIPNLILQPVIENAIKYGLYNTTEDVCIHLYAAMVNNDLHLSISNPFDAQAVKNSTTSNGFGLKAIARRLQLIYGSPKLLNISSLDNIFKTTLIIPQ
jgi:two-component system, LytTR family, sensor kinase